ncbi:MAG: homoserine O-acetyltransferase [Puniceicoccales bacterium]|jgi:homoserine O-acetyltransferase|nr:homoserine O-acetyltransferase [Puniceicoccales bacterium]
MTDDDTTVSPDIAPAFHDIVFPGTFALELGGALPALTLRYETYGALNAAGDNAVLVCHALTGDHHVAGRYAPDDPKPGWWDGFVGAGRPLDPARFFIIGVNVLGGCRGSTGPCSPNPATGAAYGPDFPEITVGDMVRAQRLLVRALGVRRLHAVIGGSLGGMQGLHWASEFPGEVANVAALACAARQGAQAIAFNVVGRAAIAADAAWQGGRYAPETPPAAGLAVARMLGHITYLCPEKLERRFGRQRRDSGMFEVESYLRHQGEKFVRRFDANSYATITRATDRFDLAERTGGDLTAALTPFAGQGGRVSMLAFSSDWLYPPAASRAVADAFRAAGGVAEYCELQTDAGHDAFLFPTPELLAAVAAALR